MFVLSDMTVGKVQVKNWHKTLHKQIPALFQGMLMRKDFTYVMLTEVGSFYPNEL